MRASTIFASSAPLLATGHAVSSHCRCHPSDACWPAPSDWAALNTTLGGNLVAVRPVASVCHDPTYDEAACAEVMQLHNDSVWRYTQPGAVQWENWEARPSTREQCYVESARDIPCGQGRVSLFSTAVESAAHIQAAVRFAGAHDIRLAIKNSGHCYLGRSSAPESLQIATHKLDSIDFVDDFRPHGCDGDGPGPAVTIGAGVYLKELYTAVGERNLTVVAGLAHTVGPAGGYIQGGGHSPLGTWKGMASDNALEFQVVTADGDLVYANDYQNTDLFWALRGGGGGTFGVVVSATLRTFADVPGFVATFGVNTTNATAYWECIRELHAHLPAINGAGGAGYYFMTPAASATAISSLSAGMIFADQTNQTVVDGVFGPLVAAAARLASNQSVTYEVIPLPLTKYFIAEAIKGESDTTGSVALAASRMVSRDFLSAADGPARVADALQKVAALSPGLSFTGHVVAGGAVAANHVDSGLNPAWRRTLTHIAAGVGWGVNATWEEQRSVQDRVTGVAVPILKALEPDMGAYLNEADPNEANFQQSFWGANYARLLEIKRRRDPRDLFITRRGVGSENWDGDGLCRVE